MALLFDRKDGYYPYPGMFTGKPFREGHLDPWIDHWRSHTAYTFRSRAKEVVVVDPIGRRTSIPVRDGLVRHSLRYATLCLRPRPLTSASIVACAFN